MAVSASVPNLSSNKYIKTYPLSTSNNTYVYTSASLTKRGTSYPYKAYNAVIYASDEIYVYSMNNTYAYISYPTSSGRRYGYIRTSAITSKNKNASSTYKSRAKINTYKKPAVHTMATLQKEIRFIQLLHQEIMYRLFTQPAQPTKWVG